MRLKTTFLIVFCVVLFLLVVAQLGSSMTSLPRTELIVGTAVRGLGATIALLAALVLLLRGANRDQADAPPAIVFPLVAGMFLFHPHWSLGLVLVAAVAGFHAKGILTGPGHGQGRRPRRHGGGGGDRP